MLLTNSEYLYLLYCSKLNELNELIENSHSIWYYRNKFNELIVHTQIHSGPIRIIYCDSDSLFFEEIQLIENKK